MGTGTVEVKKKMSDKDLKYLLDIVEEVRAILIPESNTWIYKSIVEEIHETSCKENIGVFVYFILKIGII